MPILKRVVNITETGEDTYEVTDSYGQPRTTFMIERDMSIDTFLTHRLNLRPGDRFEINYLDETTPTARVGVPRPARPDRPRTGRRKAGNQGDGSAGSDRRT